MSPKTEPKSATGWLLAAIEDEAGGLIHFPDGSTSYSVGRFDEDTAAALQRIVELHQPSSECAIPTCTLCQWDIDCDAPKQPHQEDAGEWPCDTVAVIAKVFRNRPGYAKWFGDQ